MTALCEVPKGSTDPARWTNRPNTAAVDRVGLGVTIGPVTFARLACGQGSSPARRLTEHRFSDAAAAVTSDLDGADWFAAGPPRRTLRWGRGLR